MRSFLVPHLSQVHADNGGLGFFSPGWRHPRRQLTSSVLLLGVRGSVPFVVDGEEIPLLPGRVVLLPAGLPHAGAAPLSDPASYYWMHFSLPEPGTVLSRDQTDTILSSGGVTSHLLEQAALIPLGFDLPEPEPHLAAFRELLNQQENPSYTGWKLQILFQQLLIHLTEEVIGAHQAPKQSSRSSRVVYGILACVAEKLTDPDLSIKSISAALELNPDYAGRRFKLVMGLSVGEYLVRERLKLAVARLEESADTLEIVAAATGFGTLRHFLRQFKAQRGLTPTEYRSHHRMVHFNTH